MSTPAHRAAGIVTRGLAAGIDLTVVLAVMGGIYVGVLFLRLLFSPQEFSFPDANAVLSVTLFIGVSVLYLTACWAVSGRTVGAVTMGLRVVSRNGELIGWLRALLRAVLCVMFGFGLFWAAVDGRRRSLQDILLRTAVVYDWDPDLHAVEPGT
ncbi:RDD family protein [Rhodococcus sp. IEGM 1307]|uniref:RDD family protein n=1 Tax=Rhodococcus sp. IEGM 1307 TaxID=3047091 RepID=UPI0024B6EA83|nr:RDD family protein [Rhodococcus sp. IEGM 1307]MDI9977629.1 RDD family protein [Rhodococcus sp. IEGM 1307]